MAPQYSQQIPQIPPISAPSGVQPNNGIRWVQGEAGAKAYPVAPGESAFLMDSENSMAYLKSTDQSGMPSMRYFSITEISPEALTPKPNVEDEFYDNTSDEKWDGVFSYHKRAVWFRKKISGNKGNYIYTFRDDSRRAELVGHYVERAEKDYGEETSQPKDVIHEKRLGYFSFCSNLDADPKEIYLNYKQRWDIEQCFDYLKNSVSQSASYAHTDDYFRGWVFLNHISLMYYYGLINALRNTKLNEKYTAEDILRLTKNIYKVDAGDGQGFHVSAIQKKTQAVLDELGVDLLRKN